MTRASRDTLHAVRGRMAFARRTPEEEATGVTFPRYEHIPTLYHDDVVIRDARPFMDELSLDREGFTLVRHKTAFAGERDLKVVNA
ncbi:MAG: hypothetical protein FJX51_07710, partial [Alphaproteobacteria bacterium]|nr:hypothetical protein [Alphaproteobacteria bacterium]